MDNLIRDLTDPNKLYAELNELNQRIASRSLSRTESDLHGESIDLAEHEYKKEMLKFAVDNRDTFIASLPLILDGMNRAFATLVVHNNHHLLQLFQDLTTNKGH